MASATSTSSPRHEEEEEEEEEGGGGVGVLGTQRRTAVLIGDSLTEQGWVAYDGVLQTGNVGAGWVAMLAEKLGRRTNVINLGMSGYNTRWMKVLLEGEYLIRTKTAATTTTVCSGSRECDGVFVVTVWLGANDASISTSPQHVGENEYVRNLASIVKTLRDTYRNARVLLIAPPPVADELFVRSFSEMFRNLPEVTPSMWMRSNARSRQYGLALKRAVKSSTAFAGVSFLDLHGKMTDEVRRNGGNLEDFFKDGLHLNVRGSRFVADSVSVALASLLELSSLEELSLDHPLWDKIAMAPSSGASTEDIMYQHYQSQKQELETIAPASVSLRSQLWLRVVGNERTLLGSMAILHIGIVAALVVNRYWYARS